MELDGDNPLAFPLHVGDPEYNDLDPLNRELMMEEIEDVRGEEGLDGQDPEAVDFDTADQEDGMYRPLPNSS